MGNNKNKNDGGPAFPRAPFDVNNYTGDGSAGMSLRDWFAGQVLAGFMANTNRPTSMSLDDARWCFTVADAMIAKRNAE